MYAKKTDDNQKLIISCLRKMGAYVQDLSKVGNGTPDLLVGYKGVTILIEVKRNDKAPYTPAQKSFNNLWSGGIVKRINCVNDLILLIEEINN